MRMCKFYLPWTLPWIIKIKDWEMAPNTKLSITPSFLELQSPDFAWKFIWTVQTNSENKMAAKKQNGHQKTKWPPNNKLSITHSFLELQSQDFVWKFQWTVWTNSEKNGHQKTKWPPNDKTDHNSLNFQSRSSRFCMVVHIDLLHTELQKAWNVTRSWNFHKIFYFTWEFRIQT